jgi:hypothetical protein
VALIMIHQYQWPEGIAGTQVARKIIIQGGPEIQTVVSLKRYMSALGELRDERKVTPKPLLHAPTIGKTLSDVR